MAAKETRLKTSDVVSTPSMLLNESTVLFWNSLLLLTEDAAKYHLRRRPISLQLLSI